MKRNKPPIGVAVHPVTDTCTNQPAFGIFAIFCFGIAIGFGIAMLAFTYVI